MINFNPALLPPFFQLPRGVSFGVSASAQRICKANPQRVLLAIGSGSTAGNVVVPIGFSGVGFSGFQLAAFEKLIISLADWGCLVQQEWYLGGGGSSAVWVQEVMYAPPGE